MRFEIFSNFKLEERRKSRKKRLAQNFIQIENDDSLTISTKKRKWGV
jgi:hypothetical protein